MRYAYSIYVDKKIYKQRVSQLDQEVRVAL